MRRLFTLLLLLSILFGATAAQARGSGADDCPAGSTDPDCVGASKTPPPAPGK